jgi:hypothetical protein
MRLAYTLQFAALSGMIGSVTATAQTPESGQTPAARLEQLDETYSSNLRKYHAPIIQEYLVSLEKLRQTMAQRTRTEDTSAVQAEINRVKSISAGSGLLPYDVLKPAPPEDKAIAAPVPKSPADLPPRKNGSADAIILAAAAAKKSSPDPAGLAEKPDGRAVPVGTAQWQIDKISAGGYRISILYSCAGKPANSTIITRLGRNSVQHPLTAAHATGGINEFRIARLGVISLEKDALGESLVLQNSDPASAAIWVRQVIIAKVTEDDKK